MNAGRVFVIGDIHGAYLALMQCLQRAEFNYIQDTLISLGDVCDGWPETAQCFEELLKMEKLHYVLGNHDYWTLQWAQKGETSEMWLMQGGQATMDSYPRGMPTTHQGLLSKAHLYLIFENCLFVHAGILPDIPLESQDRDIFLMDRSLCYLALNLKFRNQERQLGPFDEIYLGHTPTIRSGYTEPVNSGNVWMLDTGAAWDGRLTILDIHTKAFFQSDPVPQLYPGYPGR